MILGAASKFFRDIFASNPHPHPVIYLRIPNRDMVALLSFIYEGKCAVAEAGNASCADKRTSLPLLLRFER